MDYVISLQPLTSDVPTLPMGLDIPALALQEGEVNAAVVYTNSDAPSMTTQKDEVYDGFVGENTDITATTIAELKCPYVNCQYVTAIGQDCVERAWKCTQQNICRMP